MRKLGLVVTLVVGGCSGETPPPPPPVVETVRVGSATVAADTNELTGSVHARVESELGFRVGGIVTERLVNRGETVRRGQVLARIDARDLREGAASSAASASAAFSDARAAEATAATAAAEERRLRGLDTAGAIAPLAYERARDQARSTEQQAKAARERASAARADASVAGNQAGYALLRAPMDGIVSDVFAEPGQVVQAGARIVAIAGGGPREAEVFLPEAMLGNARRDPRASLYAGGRTAPAILREVSAAADPVTRTFLARYVLSGDAAVAPLGSTVTIGLGGSAAAAAGVQVPIGAIVKRGGPALVYVVDRGSGRALPRQVVVVSMGSETATVRGQLRRGDLIVRMGGFLLKPGQRVRLAPSRQVTGS